MTHVFRLTPLAVGLLMASQAAIAADANPTSLPPAPEFEARGQVQTLPRDRLFDFRALEQYQEPAWVREKVEKGVLPPVEERLPAEPLVFEKAGMPDGIGVYGGVLRHVIGGRPEGWNWAAGQTQGWGGISYTVAECLTRTGPLFMLPPDEQEPLPNLARRWEWSEDGRQLTMHLVEGAHWSDGAPFTSEDVRFYWEDNVLDPNVATFASPGTYGEGTTLEVVDEHTVRWTFQDPASAQVLFQMAFFSFCPGPAHVLKEHHPRYNEANSYNDYVNALPVDELPIPTMGAWVPTEYRSDELVLMRRNPYYWKVDSAGNQLPYVDEMQFKLTTWSDRTVQAVAGSADFSNMENPANYVSALQRAHAEEAPARLEFGPRTVGWSLDLNLAEEMGTDDDRQRAIRQLNRQLTFRQALSHAIDRQALGQSLVRGPFTHAFAGGVFPEGPAVDADSVVFYGYDPELANALLDDLGLKDTDGSGLRNWTEGPMAGEDLEITLQIVNEYPTDVTLAEGLVAMFRDIGIRLIPRPMSGTAFDNREGSAQFDMLIRRADDHIVPIQTGDIFAPLHEGTPVWHLGSDEFPRELMPFEQRLAELMTTYQRETDGERQAALIGEFNRVFTENLYQIGLTSAPGALIVNKRLKNVPAGTPIRTYQWAEDALIRERLWTPEDQQLGELRPETLPVGRD
ncbi:ABC transporter substrate-binding protein [Halomonas nitroreducens]|uniref:ABC transporter substrate-binding protein n=1 Tax=Halomonas nitroreducens TaxID=447425 RepID=A0A3S0HPK2_9GAMM|nr:ABC transporter substrate-binding protein [Halomonas nitroreducens]RTR02976.1 ABC transporter substrate-binding protein [Halomonas nitroreducens]